MLKKFRQEQPNIINQEFKEDRDRKRRIADKITSENVKKTKPCKVVCFGVICQDRILRIDEYPEPDWHCRLKKEGTFPGGEALNTSVALARWGIRTRLVGNLIGADEEARNISLYLKKLKHLDTTLLKYSPKVTTPKAAILASDDGNRTILGCFHHLRAEHSQEESFTGAKILALDPFLGQASCETAINAKRQNIKVITIEILPENPIASHSDVVILSSGFMKHLSKPIEFGKIAKALFSKGVKLVIQTNGTHGCLYLDKDKVIKNMPAFNIGEVEDSTGAGDIFRAGIIFGMLKGWADENSIIFASAAGALSCKVLGGSNPPSLPQIRNFIQAIQKQ